MEVIILAVDKDKNTQVLVTFPVGMLEEIDQYWHDRKLMNRNETIRQLYVRAFGLFFFGGDSGGLLDLLESKVLRIVWR